MANLTGLHPLDRRHLLKTAAAGAVVLGAVSLPPSFAKAQNMPNGADNFYKSDRVTVQKVTFKTQYQTTITGNLIVPKDLDRRAKAPALVVGHPMGAVTCSHCIPTRHVHMFTCPSVRVATRVSG